MERFALAIALACVLSGIALAGEIHTTGAPAPAPAPAPTTQSSSVLTTVILTVISLVR